MTFGKAAAILFGGLLLAVGGCGMFLAFLGPEAGYGPDQSRATVLRGLGALIFVVGVCAALVGFLVGLWKMLKAIFTKTP